jgi:hypothetical protein
VRTVTLLDLDHIATRRCVDQAGNQPSPVAHAGERNNRRRRSLDAVTRPALLKRSPVPELDDAILAGGRERLSIERKHESADCQIVRQRARYFFRSVKISNVNASVKMA